jgi:hypothetical protein
MADLPISGFVRDVALSGQAVPGPSQIGVKGNAKAGRAF